MESYIFFESPSSVNDTTFEQQPDSDWSHYIKTLKATPCELVQVKFSKLEIATDLKVQF